MIKLLNTQQFLQNCGFTMGLQVGFYSVDMAESCMDAPEIIPAGSSASWNKEVAGNIGFIVPTLRGQAVAI